MTDRFNISDLIKKGYSADSSGLWSKNGQKPVKSKKVAQMKPTGVLSLKPGTAKLSPNDFAKKFNEIKPHKYHAKSKIVDGVRYDSQREYEFSRLLRLHNIQFGMKIEYVLQEGFEYMGEKIRPIKIIPDFNIYKNGKLCAIVDIKGMILPDFKIKVKMLKNYFFKEKCSIPIFMPTNKKEMNETIHELLKIIAI